MESAAQRPFVPVLRSTAPEQRVEVVVVEVEVEVTDDVVEVVVIG
jgi:hypothetical protein